jgi:hypothetical protein
VGDPERVQAKKQMFGSERRGHDPRTMRPDHRKGKPCKGRLPD